MFSRKVCPLVIPFVCFHSAPDVFSRLCPGISFVFSLCSVHVLHNCVHNMHDDTSTHVDCSALLKTDYQESSHTLVHSHCSCTSHGLVLNASRNLDGSGAWSQTTASEKTCLVCLALVEMSWSSADIGGRGGEREIGVARKKWETHSG